MSLIEPSQVQQPITLNGSPASSVSGATAELYEKLLDSIRITAKTRFQASARLAFHHKVSQWTIAMSSVVLVLASLLAMQDGAAQALPRAGEIEVILAVFVLVLSLLIGMDNYPLRADKMHTCALDLNALVREYSVLDESQYAVLADKYGNVLNKFENHGNVDYDVMTLRSAVAAWRKIPNGFPLLAMFGKRKELFDYIVATPKSRENSRFYRNKLRWMIFVRYSLSLLPYVAASLVVVASVYYFWHKLSPSSHSASASPIVVPTVVAPDSSRHR